VVSGVPSVACLPLGVWLAVHVGYRPVFVAGGVAALAGLASVPWLPRPGRAGPATGILAVLFIVPAVVLAAAHGSNHK
jgi:predicted MFS family arabinose efflux permease